MKLDKSKILSLARFLFFLITVSSLLAFVFYEFHVLTTPLDKPIDKKVRESHKNTLIVALTFSILSGLLFFINKSQSKSTLDNILYNDFDSYVDVSV